MSDWFIILFLVYLLLFLWWLLFKPRLFSKWFKFNFSRKKIVALFGSLSLLFFVLVGPTAPEIEQDIDQSENEIVVQGNESEASASANETELATEPVELFLVTRVIDGDTVELESGERVRYIGIDTSEVGDCYSQEATLINEKLVLNKQVKLEKDVSETDRYNRLLRYVYVDDIFVNEYLVKEGFAHASSYPPDVKFQDQLRKFESEARDQEKGFWGEVCNPVSPVAPSPPSFQ
jgi:micrococcal nuclease